MSRAPYNVLVLPYYIYENNIEYCIFKRADMNVWQFIAGGGEDDEEPISAAIRESLEEASIASNSNYRQLVSMGYVSVENFSEKARQTWGKKLVILTYEKITAGFVNDIYHIKTNSEDYILKKYNLLNDFQIDLSISVQRYMSNKNLSPQIFIDRFIC